MYPDSLERSVEVLDTPRDLDQSPLLTLTALQKIALVKLNDALGIHYTEAGFPESNQADRAVYQYFREHPRNLSRTKLAAFGATRRAGGSAEKDPGLRALVESGAPALVVVGKASRTQVEAVLRTTTAENLAMIRDTFQYLRSVGIEDLTFDAEHFFDGWKEDADAAMQAVDAAAEAGVRRIVLCDTKGGSFPHEVARITEETVRAFGGRAVIGVHMHNDGDMATANTLAGIAGGARHYQGTWHGQGERVGNANHTAVLPNLHRMGYSTVPLLAQLKGAAEEAAEILHARIPRNAPFVGADAFTHKAGQHVRGNQRFAHANQFMDAGDVGNESRSILSKQAGHGNIEDFLARAVFLDHTTRALLSTPRAKDRMLQLLKEQESRGIRYRDAEASFLLMVLRDFGVFHPRFQIERYEFLDSSESGAQATLEIRVNGDDEPEVQVGRSRKGVVDALQKAFLKALGRRIPETKRLELLDYEVHKLPSAEGTASEVQVVVEFSDGEERFYTTGVGPDVLAASSQAMSDAIHYCVLKAKMRVRSSSQSSTQETA